MSDLENMPEVTEMKTQPTDAVAAEVEVTEPTPQGDATEQVEFVIEGEGDQEEQPNNNFDDVQKRRAAFAESKRKEREAKAAAEAEKKRANELQKRLDALESKVGEVTRGARPSPYDFDSDEEFDKAYDAWKGTAKPQPVKQEEEEKQSFEPDYDAEFEFNEGAEKLKKGGISDFDEKESALSQELTAMNLNPEIVLSQFKRIGKEAGFNSANAIYMIGRNPSVLKELSQCRSELQMAKLLERESLKVKPRQHKAVETKPEPTINSSGPIDNTSKAIDKARSEWVNAAPDEKLSKWNAYQTVKKQAKVK